MMKGMLLILLLLCLSEESFSFSPNPTLVNIPDNTALDLGPYTCVSPTGDSLECGSIVDYSGFVYDQHRHQMLMFGGGHAATFRNDVDVFDFRTLTWGSAYPPTPCSEMTLENIDVVKGTWKTSGRPISRHTYDMLVVDNHTKDFIILGPLAGTGGCAPKLDTTGKKDPFFFGGKIHHYDPVTKVWKPSAAAAGTWHYTSSSEDDPVSGMVIIVNNESLWTYDPVHQIAKKRLTYSKPAMGYANNLVYYPPNDKMYYIARGTPTKVFQIALDRSNWNMSTVTEVAKMAGDVPDSQESGWAFDSVNQIIGGGVKAGKFYAYNPLANTWTSKLMQTNPVGRPVGTLAFHALDYDPINNVFIFITDRASGRHTWAYRYARGQRLTTPNSPPDVQSQPKKTETLFESSGIQQSHRPAAAAPGARQGKIPHQAQAVIGATPVHRPVQSQRANTITIFDSSGTQQLHRPVSVARVFRQGEIPHYARAAVNGTPVLTQCDVKNRWPDASVKFAIISFVIPNLPANGLVTVTFANQATGNNTGYLTASDMLDPAYNFDGFMDLAAATTQTVSARSMLTNGHFRYWLQGPIVTAVIIEDRTPTRMYDRDFGDGSKALHPIFEAWFYPQNQKVDLGYTIENTWASSHAVKSMRDLTYGLVLRSGLKAPTVEFSHPPFNHIARSRLHKRFWLGTDPKVIRVDHNIQYLVTTNALPNYDTNLTIAESLIQSTYKAWVEADKTLNGGVKGIGNYKKAMGTAGESQWIGLMPLWETLYLLTMDDRMREVSLGNADLAGRIPVHFREADTTAGSGGSFDAAGMIDTFGHTVSVNARKTVTLTDLDNVCSGGVKDNIHTGAMTHDGWAISHNHLPDVAYVPYLMTGRYYYLEELQYWASFVVSHKLGCYGGTFARQGDAGYLNNTNVRGDAWNFRTLAYAAFIAPDGSPEKAYYEDKLFNNIVAWEGVHHLPISDPSRQKHWEWGHRSRTQNPMWSHGVSPLGMWSAGSKEFVQSPLRQDGSLAKGTSPWEENFLVSVLGMAKQFGYPTEKLLHFLAKTRLHLLLNPHALKYLIETYRYPTIVTATNDWVQTWKEFTSFYDPVPTGWRTGGSVDHGYGFIALAAMSYLYDQTVDSYTGKQAWELFKAEKPDQDKFATVSPKWAILPRNSKEHISPSPPANPTPSSLPRDLRKRKP